MARNPACAALATGDHRYDKDATPLLDPALNLRIGQDYIAWLMQRGVGYDLFRTVAAYNGGPGAVLKTLDKIGRDPDPLMLIECLPAQETRNYVEKVMDGEATASSPEFFRIKQFFTQAYHTLMRERICAISPRSVAIAP